MASGEITRSMLVVSNHMRGELMRQITLGRYVTRTGRKPGVREHTQSAVASSKSAYQRLSKAKSPAAALNDKKLRRDLRRVSRSAGAALIALGAPPRTRTRNALALGATLSALLIAAGVLFARSDRLRAKGQGKQSEQVEEPDTEQPPANTPGPAPLAPAEPSDDPLG